MEPDEGFVVTTSPSALSYSFHSPVVDPRGTPQLHFAHKSQLQNLFWES